MDLITVLRLQANEIVPAAFAYKQSPMRFSDCEACIEAFTRIFRARRILDFMKLWFICDVNECALMMRVLSNLYIPNSMHHLSVLILEHLAVFYNSNWIHPNGDDQSINCLDYPNVVFHTQLEKERPSFVTAIQSLPDTMHEYFPVVRFVNTEPVTAIEFDAPFLKNNMLMHLALRLTFGVTERVPSYVFPEHLLKECIVPLLNQFWNAYERLSHAELLTLINTTTAIFKMGRLMRSMPLLLDPLLESMSRDMYKAYWPLILDALCQLSNVTIQTMTIFSQTPRRAYFVCRILLSMRPAWNELLTLSYAFPLYEDSFGMDYLNDEPFFAERAALYMLQASLSKNKAEIPIIAVRMLAAYSVKNPGRNVIEAVFHTVSRAMVELKSELFNAYVLRMCISPGNMAAAMRLIPLLDEPAFVVWTDVFAFSPFVNMTRNTTSTETDVLTNEPVLRKFHVGHKSESLGIESMLTAFAMGGMVNPFTNLPVTWNEIAAANDGWSLSL